MTSPTHNPGDQPRDEVTRNSPEGPRPGRHPSVERTSGGRTAAIALAVILTLVALVFVGRVIAATLSG